MTDSVKSTINSKEDIYDVGSGEQLDDLVALIEDKQSYPMSESSGEALQVLQPDEGASQRAQNLDLKVMEMEEFEKTEKKSVLDEEFNSLNLAEETNEFTTVEGTKTENMVKNRYKNILPYDQTRVILHKINDDDDHSDYVNANYIRSPHICESSSSLESSTESLNSVKSLTLKNDCRKSITLVSRSLSDEALKDLRKKIKQDAINGNIQHIVKNKTYIATQGCLTTTVNDFWYMIWQEDVRVIVMITKETERGKAKCDRYWPLSDQEECYGNLQVKSKSETTYEDYCLRELVVQDEDIRRIIYHYQFTAWPDHGTPREPDGVLSFLNDVNNRMYQNTLEFNAPEQNMVCVHCSAGVGRTGTFIVIDMLIDKIKKFGFNCDIDVYNTVRVVRSQRSGMVQNKEQYRFIYMALQSYIDKKELQRKKRIYNPDA